MSSSGDGKPAQTGLVDMGVIQFYNLPQNDPHNLPSFTIGDLANYPGTFSEMVLNVTWNQLQSTPGGPINFSAIDSPLATVAQYNTDHGANLGVKLRVWGGFTAPDWAKNLDGPALTINGQSIVDPNVYGPQTIGRWWTADYVDAWTSLQNGLANRYDGNALVHGISQTAGGSASDEPFVPFKTDAPESAASGAPTVNQVYVTQQAGFTDAAEKLTLRAAIADYASWSTTPLDFTFNPLSLFDNFVSGNPTPSDDNFTLAVLQQARNSDRLVQAGNHTIKNPPFPAVTFILSQLAADAALDPAAAPASYQTASPLLLGDTPGHSNYQGWQGAVTVGVGAHAGNIELWDYSQNNGFQGLSAAQVRDLGTMLANGIAPTTGAPDNGSALDFLAPAFVTGGPGTVAFSGTGAVLLESATQQNAYTVTLTSSGGHTLAVTDHSGIVSGPVSGSTLSFSGSLAQVNTVLASLRDTLSSGTDVVQIRATDSSGHTVLRNVGVEIAADGTASGGAGSGQGSASQLAIADQLAASGMLLVGGVQASQSVAGNLQIGPGGGANTLIAALAPSAYSTASLAVGGTFEVLSGGAGFFTGGLGAQSVKIDQGGALTGDGTLTAAVGSSIVNKGTIEAAADFTLGLQRLRVANDLTGTDLAGTHAGTLQIDAGATLVLGGKVDATQTITFAASSIAQFALGPYSPSTLVIEAPSDMAGSISGFTFADRLVLEGLSLTSSDVSYNHTTHELTVTGVAQPFSLTGDTTNPDLTGLDPTVVAGDIILFAPPGDMAPSVAAPSDLEGAAGSTVLVPDIVINTPQPTTTPADQSVHVTLVAGAGTLSAGDDNGNITPLGNGTGTVMVSGTLDQVERSLQSLTYSAPAAGGPGPPPPTTDTITITVSDYAGPSVAPKVITVHNNAAPLQFSWNTSGAGGGSFADAASWTAAPHNAPPGGTNIALFVPGTYTVSGDGAVGQILAHGTTTLTGHVTAQGRGGPAIIVDDAGALTLAAGAALTAQQEAIVGQTGQGLFVLMGGTLALTGPSAQNALVIGQQSGSTGTVVNLEQLTANGTVVVGGAGSGALSLLGIASTVMDGGADIGQSAGGQGSVTVNGGEWTNSGQLTVGDAGIGSLLINGMAGGITGQVTAFNATIGNQAGGQGSVLLDGGELLVANISAASSILAVGAAGAADLELDDGSEVAVGAAQATVNQVFTDNNGLLTVGGQAGGRGRVRIGGNSALLVYGNAIVGAAGAGTGQVTVGESADDIALFALMGTLAVNGGGQIGLGGSHATLRARVVDVAGGGVISGAGTLSGIGGGNSTVTLASIDNEGSIEADGGDLLVYGGVGGTGTLSIGTNATMTLQAAVGSGQTMVFGQNSKAVLNDARAFAGTITGFGSDDLLELASTAATGATWADGVLTVDTAFGPIRLQLAGAYASNAFTVQSDGLGGTYVLGGGNGDVHMLTFDGLYYDFQAVGEFIAVRSTDLANPWQIQIRTESFPGATSITTGLAATLGNDRVSFAVGRANPVYIDGAPDTALHVGEVQSFAGGTLTQLSAAVYRLTWNAGESVTVTYQDGYMDWSVSLGPHDGPGSVQGLLGSHRGRANDFQLPDGSVLRQPLRDDEILGVFADAWRVAPGASLLGDISPPAAPVTADPHATSQLVQFMAAMGGDASGGAPVPPGAASSQSAGDLAAAFSPSSPFHA